MGVLRSSVGAKKKFQKKILLKFKSGNVGLKYEITSSVLRIIFFSVLVVLHENNICQKPFTVA